MNCANFHTTLLDKRVTFTHPVQDIKVGSSGTIIGVRTEMVQGHADFVGPRPAPHSVLYLTIKARNGRILDRVKTTEVMLDSEI